MKVKIDNKLYDSQSEPIMLVFENDMDRITHANNILKMLNGTTKYLVYDSNNITENEACEFMQTTLIDAIDTDTLSKDELFIESIVVECKDGKFNTDFNIYARTNKGENIRMEFCQLLKLNISANELLPSVDLNFLNPIIDINLKGSLEGATE